MSEAVKVALIVSIAPTLAAVFSMVISIKNRSKLDQLSINIDGRLSELLAVSKRADHADGVVQGRQEERERQENHAER